MLPRRLPGGCTLRPFEEADAEDLERVIAENRAHQAEWLPWVDTTSGVHDRLEFIRAARRQMEDDEGFQAAIVDEDGAIVGAVGFPEAARVRRGGRAPPGGAPRRRVQGRRRVLAARRDR